VTLEGLLAFIGILVAVFAIARPVQRRSLSLFVPVGWLGAAILVSFALIICRDAPFGVGALFGRPLPQVMFGLTTAAFVIPVSAAIWSWVSWHRAKLTRKRIGRAENVFQAALREREFDEVERILRNNREGLEQLPASAASVLFHPAMVAALLDSHSLVHLELLANVRFLKSLENRYEAVDVVVRTLLRSDVSPLRSAVVSKYGGLEHLIYSDAEQKLIEQTFQNPEWYFEASAHYALVMSAVEVLRGGKFDSVYNDVGRDYEASQGISTRSYCPIYLALKTEVLAIEAALEGRVDKDFYVTDLLDIFRAVQGRSKFNASVWRSPLANHEHPTPYSYLLYEISSDLRDLSAKAVQEATSKTQPPQAENPGRLARDLALTWSFCVWNMSAPEDQVSEEFRNHVIEQYLVFMLALGWEPGEIYSGSAGNDVQGLDVWRELFLVALQKRFAGDRVRREVLKDAIGSLDLGKRYVYEGYDWLNEKLLGTAPTN
jgi:hypothetical protein